MEPYSIVTGAAGGLGQAYVTALLHRGKPIIAIDLPEKGLPDLCRQWSAINDIAVVPVETDLTQLDRVLTLTETINDKYPVSVLINNAGIGGTKRFEEAELPYLLRIMQLNMLATTVMTRKLLPNLQAQEEGFVLNVSSIAAFMPIAYKTVYPASKAFVYRFTRGLQEEYRHTPLHFCVVNPGPMATNPSVKARIQRQGWLAKMGLNTPEKVAEHSLQAMFQRKSCYIPNLFGWIMLKLLPNTIRLPLLSMGLRKELRTERQESRAQ